jgi:hypothetical protein
VDACNPLLQAHPTWARDEHEGRRIPTSLMPVSGRLALPLRARPRARPIWAGARGDIHSSAQGSPGLGTPTGMRWRGRTFHLHMRTFLPWSSCAGMAMAGRRGHRERGRGCSGGVGPSMSTCRPSFLGAVARGWRCVGRRGRRERGARESERLQAEPCTKMCVCLHYCLIE